MFLFIMETMQHVITQHNGFLVAEKEFYPFPLYLTTRVSLSHIRTRTHELPFPIHLENSVKQQSLLNYLWWVFFFFLNNLKPLQNHAFV